MIWTKQLDSARREVAGWPRWMRELAGLYRSEPMTQTMSRHPSFDMTPQVGKWYFHWLNSWVPAGAYDSRKQAFEAAMDFYARGTTSEFATLIIGQWVNMVVPDRYGREEIIPAAKWQEMRDGNRQ